jgi:microsomal dipeptidase-like Zn-dependent dipeptidase
MLVRTTQPRLSLLLLWLAGVSCVACAVQKEKKQATQEAAAYKREQTKKYFKDLEEMNRRVSRRKMLFEQATQENLRRQVLEKFDEVRLRCVCVCVCVTR